MLVKYGTRKRTLNATVFQDKKNTENSDAMLPNTLKQLYRAPLPISEAKKKDFIKLCEKGVIPEEYHAWF